jgi:hypothetical protein
MEILLAIITLGLKPLYDKNKSYYEIVNVFRKKLPRQQNQAKKLSDKEKSNHPFIQGSLKHMSVINMSPHKTSLTEAEIDQFYNELNDFNYSFVFFKDYYQKYTRNLNRFNPKAENKNFELAVLQIAIKEDPLHPLKPWAVFKLHLKYKWKLSSSVYMRFRKKKKRN